MRAELEVRRGRLADALYWVDSAIAETKRRAEGGADPGLRGLERLRVDIVEAMRLLEKSSLPGDDAAAPPGGHLDGVTSALNRG